VLLLDLLLIFLTLLNSLIDLGIFLSLLSTPFVGKDIGLMQSHLFRLVALLNMLVELISFRVSSFAKRLDFDFQVF
jgi:hypothetical protein